MAEKTTTTPGEPVYVERPVFANAFNVALQAGGVGVVVAAIDNAVSSHNRGGWGVLTRSGNTIGFLAAMGATFALTDSWVANIRRKDDHLNGVAAGCAAGFLAGIRARSLPMAVSSCAILGASVGVYDYTSQAANSASETKEERRKRFFKQPPPSLEAAPTDAAA